MKELSIEEKVEAYDKVSKEVKDFFEGKRKMCSNVTKALEDLFPELKESEDEKIRKWIINEIKVKHHNLDEDNVDFVDKAIAWLDKQGKPNPYSGVSFEYNGHTWGMCARDGGVEIGYDRNLKAFLSPEKSFIYSNNHSQEPTAPEPVMEAVKEEGVSNSAKEDKPKFKIGDWIVNPKGETLHITDIDGSCYVFNNNKSHFWITCYCDQQCHLWTIEDAKDGDVLVEDSCIFIIQKLGDNSTAAKTYCTLYDDGEFNDGSILYFDIDSTKPATKKEIELLFNNMKEAGYKWDSENRKLIKE